MQRKRQADWQIGKDEAKIDKSIDEHTQRHT